jgi:outer membrane protein assembly factor BamD (BamD/ComL family)
VAKKIRVSKLLLILGIWLVLSANLYSNVFADFQTFQSDTNKVKSMFSDIDDLMDVGNFTKAYQKLDSVDLLSEQFDYEYGLAFSGVKRAEILIIKKQIDSALTEINKVIDQFPESRLRFNFYNTQAAAYNYKGLSNQAIE